MPHANDAEGSIPVVENDVIIEVVDLPDDIEVIIEVVEPTEEDVGGVVAAVGGTKEEEVPEDDIPEDTESDEYFREQFNAHQDFGDSDDEEVVVKVPKKKLEPALMYQAGFGRFSKDINELCKEVQAEMIREYSVLKNNPPAWRKVVNRLRNTWHPDKNDDVFKRKSEEVFKCLQNEKKKLESRK